MRCPLQPKSIQYLNWKKDADAILDGVDETRNYLILKRI